MLSNSRRIWAISREHDLDPALVKRAIQTSLELDGGGISLVEIIMTKLLYQGLRETSGQRD